MKKNKLVLVAVMLVLALAPAAAFAALSAVGPVVPYNAATHTGNGFPHYYVDSIGQACDIQSQPFPPPFHAPFGDGVGLVPPTLIFAPVVIPPPIGYTAAMAQFSADIGFDVECFYYYMQPDRVTFDQVIDPAGRGGAVNVVIGMEAGFATVTPILGAPVDGNQATFQRIRFNWKTAPDGRYRFTHPYGVLDQTQLLATGGGGLKVTIDQPLAAPLNFTGALSGPINVFCQQVSPPPLISGTPPPGFNLPSNWYGDGFSPATFTGAVAPNLNQFTFQAFLLDGVTPNNIFTQQVPPFGATNTVTTNKAVIAGHKFVIPPPPGKKGKIVGVLDLLLF